MKEPWIVHERLDTYYYAATAKVDGYIPTLLGTDIRQLGLRLTLDVAMLGIGGLWAWWWRPAACWAPSSTSRCGRRS